MHLRRALGVLLCLALAGVAPASWAEDSTSRPTATERSASVLPQATEAVTSKTVGSVNASVGPGTGAPPSHLGALPMVPFPVDQRVGEAVVSADGPSGPVTFSEPLTVAQVGDDWDTWSHGYAGTVFVSDGPGPITLTLPPGTRSFYLYAEPNTFDVYSVVAVAQEGATTLHLPVQGEAGAAFFGFYTTGTALLTSIVIATDDESFAIGELGIAHSANSGYIALGDSYSSGEGAAGPGGYGAGKCHRTDNAWPNVLSRQSARLHLIANFACSGAETPAITSSFQHQDPQGTDLMTVPSALTVTVTIGGNDIGFGRLIKDCVILDPCDDELDRTRRNLDKKGGLTTRLANAYRQIQGFAPHAHLVVVGYPRIFPKSPGEKRKCGWLEDKELRAAADLAKALDKEIEKTAWSVGASYVSTLKALEGHEECSKNPWMVAIRAPGNQEMGHPDQQGQKAIGKVVAEALE